MNLTNSLIADFKGIRFGDIFAGIPAGMVLFMSSFLAVRLYEKYIGGSLPFFATSTIIAALIGWLLRIVRFSRAGATALVAGVTGASLLSWLWVLAYKSNLFPAVSAVPGLLLVMITPWLIARTYRPKGKIPA